MVQIRTRIGRLLAASALVSAPLCAQAGSIKPGQKAVVEAMRLVPEKVDEAVAQLSAIEPDPVAELVELCGRSGVPADWLSAEEEPLPLTVLHQAVVLEVLGTFDARVVLDHVRVIERGQRDITRRAALIRVVGYLGGSAEFPLLARLAKPLDASPLAEVTRNAFEASVRAWAESDPNTLRALRTQFGSLDHRLIVSAIAGLEQAAIPGLVDGLAELLRQVPAVDSLLIAAIARTAERARPPFQASTCAKVRNAMSGGRPRHNALVAAAIGALEDYEGIPTLVEALDDQDPNLRRAAARALRKITGQSHGLDSSRWAIWYWVEQRWWNEEATDAFSTLRHGDSSEAIGVIRELAQRGLFRHELAELACDGLQRDEPEVVALVCQLLRDLDSVAAVEPLKRALAHNNLDQETRELALATLEAIVPGEAEREIQ